MALRKLKEKALEMRKRGLSYSQIRSEVKVSKSTLSLWLRNLPLSRKRISELRDNSAVRIEKCRNTKAIKRQVRLDEVYKKVSGNIGDVKKLTEREIFLCGLFLYWGEGSKTNMYSVEITNTDPSMIKFALLWFSVIGINKKDIALRLKVYKDTNHTETIRFWSNLLCLKKKQIKLHTKMSNQSDITYKGGFGRGTCSLVCWNRDKSEYIMQSLRYFKNYFL